MTLTDFLFLIILFDFLCLYYIIYILYFVIFCSRCSSMKEIYFEYNPFTLEFKLEENGKKFNSESKIYSYSRESKRLQSWIHKFIPELYEIINEDFVLNFKGTSFDYDDIQFEIDEFNKKHQTNIESSLHEVKSIDTRLQELVKLFNSIKEESPIDELKDENIFARFYSDINKEFEIAVVATVSSGKSTLINSLLGKELMPSKKQACTSTIIRIKDVDNSDNVSVLCRDENENIIDDEAYKADNADIDIIRKFNEDEKVYYIDLEMDIPFVDTNTLELVLLDTPGPNNFSDKTHKEKTRKVINKSDPLILYVIDGVHQSTDNRLLLEDISKAMKRGGRQGKDRFIFVVNKVDELDIDSGDSIEQLHREVIQYLKDFEIVNPNIYFVSARMAMIIKLISKKENLRNRQNKSFFDSSRYLFEEYEEFNLNQYSSISKNNKLKIENILNNSKDDLEKILIYSGIPALEFGIKDYLEKYAMAEKMEKAIKSFLLYIDENNFIDKINEILLKKEDENSDISETIMDMEEQIKSCESAIPYFIDKINKLDMHDKIKTDFENILNNFSARLSREMDIIFEDTIKKSVGYNVQKGINEVKDVVHSLYSKVVNTPKIASNENDNTILLEDKYYKNYNISTLGKEEYCININKIIKELLSQLNVELYSYLDKNINFVLENIINEYKISIYNTLNELAMYKFISKGLSIESGTLFDRCSINDINNTLNNYILSKKIELKPEFKDKWWDIQSWDIRLWDEFNIKDYNENVYNKLIDDIKSEIDNIIKNSLENIQNLKNYILSEIEKLEYVLKSKKEDLKNKNITKEELERFIEKEKNKLVWIQDVKSKLEDIITL